MIVTWTEKQYIAWLKLDQGAQIRTEVRLITNLKRYSTQVESKDNSENYLKHSKAQN